VFAIRRAMTFRLDLCIIAVKKVRLYAVLTAVIFAVLDVSFAVNSCLNRSFFTFISLGNNQCFCKQIMSNLLQLQLHMIL